MALILRRETFIALRARRQAYRIASEILNPSIPPPTELPRDPAEVVHEDQWLEAARQAPAKPLLDVLREALFRDGRLRWKVILLILADLALIALIPLFARLR